VDLALEDPPESEKDDDDFADELPESDFELEEESEDDFAEEPPDSDLLPDSDLEPESDLAESDFDSDLAVVEAVLASSRESLR
jgi:hypothetical protein